MKNKNFLILFLIILVFSTLFLSRNYFSATLEVENKELKIEENLDKKECQAENYECSVWETSCNLNLKQERVCRKITECEGGYKPITEKNCSQIGIPQKYSAFSSCNPEEIAKIDESFLIKGKIIAENIEEKFIKDAYVWLTDKNNKRLYLENTSNEVGEFELILGLEDLKENAGKKMNLHIASIDKGYGGNVGYITSLPQCSLGISFKNNSQTSIGEKTIGLLDLFFEEKIESIEIPEIISAKGGFTEVEILIDLSKDAEGIKYKLF